MKVGRVTLASLLIILLTASIIHAQTSTLVGWMYGSPVQNSPASATNVIAVSACLYDTLWLNADGTLGYASTAPISEITSGISSVTGVKAIDVAERHVLVLLSNGVVVAWDAHQYSYGQSAVPSGLSNVIAIAAGFYHGMAVTGGTVVGWGTSTFGQLNIPAGLNNVVAVSAGKDPEAGHCLALKGDGTVVAWGKNDFGQASVPSGLSNVVAISAGSFHSVALKADGTVAVWGGTDPAFRAVPVGLSGVTAIAAGRWETLALRNNGTIAAWGADTAGSAIPVPDSFTNCVAIAAGIGYNVAVLTDLSPRLRVLPWDQVLEEFASSYCWVEAAGPGPFFYQWRKDGTNLVGATNQQLWLHSVTFSDTGDYSCVVSNQHGTAITPPARITIVPAPARIVSQPQDQFTYAGGDATFAVQTSGSSPISYQWYQNTTNSHSDANAISGATNSILPLINVSANQLRYYFVIATNAGGSATSRVALLTVTNRIEAPVIAIQPQSDSLFVGAKFVLSVTAGGVTPLTYHWSKDGALLSGETSATVGFNPFAAGDAGSYQVIVSNSFGTVTSSVATLTVSTRTLDPWPPPSVVVNLSGALLPPGLTNIVAIAAGAIHGLAVRADGTVAAWGNSVASAFGVANVPAWLSNVVAVAAGRNVSFALLADGTVAWWSFGGGFGDQGIVPGLFSVVALTAQDHALALKSDGRVVNLQNSAIPSDLSNVSAIAAGGTWDVVAKTDGQVSFFGPAPLALPPSSNIVRVATSIGVGTIGLRSDGVVVPLVNGAVVPSGLNNVVNISAAHGAALALKNDGTVIGWGTVTAPESLTNVSAIAAGRAYSLVLTTNPPPPALAGKSVAGKLQMTAPVSVSGYALEAADDLGQSFILINVITNEVNLSETNPPVLQFPTDGSKRFYRFRKL
jgi:alpha-tubulin suppressor-like RCC1 family protein